MKTKTKKVSTQKRGPKPTITLEVVKRVGEGVGLGLTLQMALDAEQKVKINPETWKKALQSHEQFVLAYEAGKAAFSVSATRRLAESEDLRWTALLLERRLPERFRKPKPTVATSGSGKAIDYEAKYKAKLAENEAQAGRGPKIFAKMSEEDLKHLRHRAEVVASARKREEQAREAEEQERARQNGNGDSTEGEHPTQQRGPKPAITLAVVKRVSAVWGRGVTLEQALAVEENGKINLETWKKALGTHKQFAAIFQGAKAKFAAWAVRRLAESKDLHWTVWVLERCQPEIDDYKAKYEELVAQDGAKWDRVREDSAIYFAEIKRLKEEAREKAALEEKARETEREKCAGQNGNGHSAAASEDGKVELESEVRSQPRKGSGFGPAVSGMEGLKSEGRHEHPAQPEPATCTRWFGQPMPETGPGQGPTGRAIIRPAVKTATDRLLESMGAYLG